MYIQNLAWKDRWQIGQLVWNSLTLALDCSGTSLLLSPDVQVIDWGESNGERSEVAVDGKNIKMAVHILFIRGHGAIGCKFSQQACRVANIVLKWSAQCFCGGLFHFISCTQACAVGQGISEEKESPLLLPTTLRELVEFLMCLFGRDHRGAFGRRRNRKPDLRKTDMLLPHLRQFQSS